MEILWNYFLGQRVGGVKSDCVLTKLGEDGEDADIVDVENKELE